MRFATWLDTTPLGAYTARNEQAWLDAVSADIFGYKAMQLQLPQYDFLRENRIPWRICAAEEVGGAIQCLPHALPIASQSIDLLVLPHVLDFAKYPQEVLREARRILMPEGRLLITGFNPWSLWACRRVCECDAWKSNWITLPRLKDWLLLMGFESMQGGYLGYTFPLQNAKWLEHTQWLNSVGDRWWPAAGSVYCLDMIKRVRGMRVIIPQWASERSTVNTVALRDAPCNVNKAVNL